MTAKTPGEAHRLTGTTWKRQERTEPTPPPVPPNPYPRHRHWTESWWFGALCIGVPLVIMVVLGLTLP